MLEFRGLILELLVKTQILFLHRNSEIMLECSTSYLWCILYHVGFAKADMRAQLQLNINAEMFIPIDSIVF